MSPQDCALTERYWLPFSASGGTPCGRQVCITGTPAPPGQMFQIGAMPLAAGSFCTRMSLDSELASLLPRYPSECFIHEGVDERNADFNYRAMDPPKNN